MDGGFREIFNEKDMQADEKVVTLFMQVGAGIFYKVDPKDVNHSRKNVNAYILEKVPILVALLQEEKKVNPGVKKRLLKFIETDLTEMEQRSNTINDVNMLKNFHAFVARKYLVLVNNLMDQYSLNLSFNSLKRMRKYLEKIV